MARAIAAATEYTGELTGYIFESDDGTSRYGYEKTFESKSQNITQSRTFSFGRDFRASFYGPFAKNMAGMFHTHHCSPSDKLRHA